MRTTVRLDEALMLSVKGYAARHGRTLTSVIEDALRQLLEEESRRDTDTPVDVVVFTGSGTQPGIDISNRTTWRHVLEEDDAEKFRVATDADA